MAAKRKRPGSDDRGVRQRSGVERHLVSARGNHLPHVGNVLETATHSIGNVHFLARSRCHRDGRLASFVGGSDVEEDDLVGTLLVVGVGQVDRVARIAQVDEVHALDDAPVLHVQARDDALGQHRALASLHAATPSSTVKAPS